MNTPTPEDAARDAIRHWYGLPQLAEFAVERHGYADTDGGFGVTYPGDLDDYDRALGEFIPEGFVEVHGFWGPPDGYEMLIPESLYLATLAEVLAEAGMSDEAQRVESLIR